MALLRPTPHSAAKTGGTGITWLGHAEVQAASLATSHRRPTTETLCIEARVTLNSAHHFEPDPGSTERRFCLLA